MKDSGLGSVTSLVLSEGFTEEMLVGNKLAIHPCLLSGKKFENLNPQGGEVCRLVARVFIIRAGQTYQSYRFTRNYSRPKNLVGCKDT